MKTATSIVAALLALCTLLLGHHECCSDPENGKKLMIHTFIGSGLVIFLVLSLEFFIKKC